MSDPSDLRDRMAGGEFDPQAVIELMAPHSHNGMIGSRYVAHADNWVELALDYDEKLVGDPATGILASGPIVSLCDMASGMSIWLTTGRFAQTVTVDLRLDYLRPAEVGKSVTARMHCYRTTKSIAFVRGQAHDGDPDRPIAQATGTFMFLEPQ